MKGYEQKEGDATKGKDSVHFRGGGGLLLSLKTR